VQGFSTQFGGEAARPLTAVLFMVVAMLAVALPEPARATAQVPDILLHEGKERALCTTPFDSAPKEYRSQVPFKPSHTGCWRGYQAWWSIVDGRLYLDRVEDCSFGDGEEWTASDLTGGREERLLADWYSGVLRVWDGEMLEYVHGGFGSVYERDLMLVIEKGVVTRTLVVNHFMDKRPNYLDMAGAPNTGRTASDDEWFAVPQTGRGTKVAEAGAWGDGWYLVGSEEDYFQRTRLLFRLDPDGSSRRFELGSGRIRGAAPAPDGGLYLIGETYGLEYDAPWFARVDAGGNLVFEKLLTEEAPGRLYGVASIPGGGALAVGEHFLGHIGESQGWLAEFADDGTVVSQQYVGGEAYHFFTDLVRTKNGGVFVSGAQRGETMQAWHARFRSTRAQKAGQQVEPTEDWALLSGTTETSDGSVVLTGRVLGSMATEGGIDRALTIRLNRSGKVSSRREFGEHVLGIGKPTAIGTDVVLVVARAENFDSRGEFEVNDWTVHLVRIPPEGEETWTRLTEPRLAAFDDQLPGALIVGATLERIDFLLLDLGKELEWRPMSMTLETPP